jgi:hypothetical protein
MTQLDERDRRSAADLDEAAELAAHYVAIFFVYYAMGLRTTERVPKGEHFDFYAASDATEANPFGVTQRVKLEVSGVLDSTPYAQQARVKEKLDRFSNAQNPPQLTDGNVLVVVPRFSDLSIAWSEYQP